MMTLSSICTIKNENNSETVIATGIERNFGKSKIKGNKALRCGVDMSAKIYSPFNQVECPVCGFVIDLSSDKDKLYQHIKDSHKNEPLMLITEFIYNALNQSIPKNLKTLSFDDLARLLSNTCKDATNKQGLSELRKGQ